MALYLAEAAIGALSLAWNQYQFVLSSLSRRQEAFLVVPAAVLVVSLVYILRCVYRESRSDPRTLLLTLALNAVPIVSILCGAEIGARVLTTHTPLGPAIRGTVLLPKSWDTVRARNRALLERAPAAISYFVSDTLLGWTIGPSRRSTDGMYASSAEAVRSAAPGVVYSGRHGLRTIALIGDSYTFGLEVKYADSWAAQLEQLLGAGFRTLNFGVDGYGVDQAYLRYARDARPWHPDLTIFGFIEHDLYRSMSVYNFITFPQWGFPFSKPRFVWAGDGLELINVPIESPAALASRRAVGDLPYIAYEPAFHPAEWRWHVYDQSQLVRFLSSRFPPYYRDDPLANLSTELSVNVALLTRFARQAAREGTVPLIVYFPSRGDYVGEDRSEKDSVLRALDRAGVRYANLTTCLAAMGGERLFIPGRPHYTPAGNRAVASCLVPILRPLLGGAEQMPAKTP